MLKVFVYYNLHRHLWSVKALEGPHKGRVVAHAHTVALTMASPKVSEKGRQRVLRDKRKNVHAGVVGTLAAFEGDAPPWWGEVSYNPYRGPSFYFKGEGPAAGADWTPDNTAGRCIMKGRRVFVD